MKSCENCRYAKSTDYDERVKCRKNKQVVNKNDLCEEHKRKK